jgi:uncharacterized membrane protein YjfL (UPF0719 family)
VIGYAIGSQAALLAIALGILAVSFGGAWLCRRRAPAVTLGLAGGALVGLVGFVASSADGPRGVPQDVGVWASLGLAVFGLLGLVFLPSRPPSTALWRATIAVAIAAPFVGVASGFLMTSACPLYVTRGAGYCFYDVDLLGGWASAVAVMIGGDLLGIAFLLGISAWQARAVERTPAGQVTLATSSATAR